MNKRIQEGINVFASLVAARRIAGAKERKLRFRVCFRDVQNSS